MAITDADIQEIASHAAALVGAALPDYSDDTKTERVIEAVYDHVKGLCLARHFWSFAMKSEAQTTVAASAGSDYSSRVALSSLSSTPRRIQRVTA